MAEYEGSLNPEELQHQGQDAVRWAVNFLATPKSERDNFPFSDAVETADSVEGFFLNLNGLQDEASRMTESTENYPEFDLCYEERRLIDKFFEAYLAQADFTTLSSKENFTNYFAEWFNTMDHAFFSINAGRAIKLRQVLNGIDTVKLRSYALTEYQNSCELLDECPEEFFVVEHERKEKWKKLMVVTNAVYNDEQGTESEKCEANRFEIKERDMICDFFGLFKESIGEFVSADEDGRKLLTFFTKWKKDVENNAKVYPTKEFRVAAAVVSGINFLDIGVFLNSELDKLWDESQYLDDEKFEELEKVLEDLDRYHTAFCRATEMRGSF